jgi:hypothetical protein
MDGYDRLVEQKKTTAMIFRFFCISVFPPLFSGALIYAYQLAFALDWGRKDWKLAVLIVWIGTLLLLAFDAFRLLRSERRRFPARDTRVQFRRVSEDGSTRKDSSRVGQLRLENWEHRKSRRILNELCALALLLPLGAGGLIWLYTVVAQIEFTRSDWKTAVFAVWIGTMFAMIRAAVSARRDQMVY